MKRGKVILDTFSQKDESLEVATRFPARGITKTAWAVSFLRTSELLHQRKDSSPEVRLLNQENFYD